ncbi:MAG: hypothetical protein KF862_24030 [Chitinophagaceae bacterium]|nr:hypothetical protein [Chitinophagaceae bacterium]
MKKEDIPQDKGALGNEVSYVVDENGKYTTGISNGWDVKIKALDVAWSDIEKKVNEAKQKLLNDEASPILYFMELKIMDLPIVAAYTGFWQWQIRRHLKPSVFNRLSEKKIQQYAELFEITPGELRNAKQILSNR